MLQRRDNGLGLPYPDVWILRGTHNRASDVAEPPISGASGAAEPTISVGVLVVATTLS
jgi:hypothetical protein